MQGDNPAAVMSRLAEIEDDMAELLPGWSEAMGFMAHWAIEERKLYLLTKAQLEQTGELEVLNTETAKKDLIEQVMRKTYPDQMAEAQGMARIAGRGKALFQGLDARRSIGQSLLKVHAQSADADRYGKGSSNG